MVLKIDDDSIRKFYVDPNGAKRTSMYVSKTDKKIAVRGQDVEFLKLDSSQFCTNESFIKINIVGVVKKNVTRSMKYLT